MLVFYSGHVVKTCFCWELGQLFFNFGHKVSLAITLRFFYKKNCPGQTDCFDECLFPPGWICQNPLAWPPLSRSSPLSEKKFFLGQQVCCWTLKNVSGKTINLIFFGGSWKKQTKQINTEFLVQQNIQTLVAPATVPETTHPNQPWPRVSENLILDLTELLLVTNSTYNGGDFQISYFVFQTQTKLFCSIWCRCN